MLFRQPVARDLSPGNKCRLSAWVRGEDLLRGRDPWRTGSVRVAFNTADGQRYAQVAELLGTFGWKMAEGALEVPEGATSAEVQAGVNGGTGTVWIDEIALAASGTEQGSGLTTASVRPPPSTAAPATPPTPRR